MALRYWVKLVDLPWQEATKEQFKKVESALGFRPTGDASEENLTTSGFSSHGVEGRITRDKFPESIEAVKKAGN